MPNGTYERIKKFSVALTIIERSRRKEQLKEEEGREMGWFILRLPPESCSSAKVDT